MKKILPEVVVVMDVGSTSLTVVAVDREGNVLEKRSSPHAPSLQPGGKEGWLIWDVERIWKVLSRLSQEVTERVGKERIRAVTVTTFGADGTLVDSRGNLLYPVVSWQGERTRRLILKLKKIFSPLKIYSLTGYGLIYFNTLFKIWWLKENNPYLFEKGTKWLMLPGILSHRLSGEFSLDPTIGSTMMLMDLKKRTGQRSFFL